MRAASLIVCVLALAGCAAAPPASVAADPISAAPTDLVLDVTVMWGDVEAIRAAGPSKSPSRYIVFPDGSLHYAADSAHGAASRPGLTRWLTREQVTELWAIARRTGLADPANGDFAGNIALVTAPPGSVVQLISFTAGDEHWAFRREFPIDAESDPAIGELIDQLALLAWAPDRTGEPLRTAPPRYYFGPDPYEMYRRP